MPGSIPKDKYININTIEQQIDNVVISFFDKYHIDIYDLDQCKKVPHNTLNLCFREIYKQLFKPDITLCNNQRSLVDYNNNELLRVLANKFVEICQTFNKSLGLMSFSFMIGCEYSTIWKWLQNDEISNPTRLQILKSVQECHKLAQISLLNDTPVGALAVANNDKETGLNWSANQVQQVTNNTVYYLPSERSDKLKLDKLDN